MLPEAGVDVTTAARLADKWFGHETDCLALLGGNLFHPLLEHHMHIGHGDRLGVNKIDFVLASAPF